MLRTDVLQSIKTLKCWTPMVNCHQTLNKWSSVVIHIASLILFMSRRIGYTSSGGDFSAEEEAVLSCRPTGAIEGSAAAIYPSRPRVFGLKDSQTRFIFSSIHFKNIFLFTQAVWRPFGYCHRRFLLLRMEDVAVLQPMD